MYLYSSPELNPAGNAQNLHRKIVRNLVKEDNGVKWSRNASAKMEVLRRPIAVLDADKNYWRKLFGSLRDTTNESPRTMVLFYPTNFMSLIFRAFKNISKSD
jgi:hypothetical protein